MIRANNLAKKQHNSGISHQARAIRQRMEEEEKKGIEKRQQFKERTAKQRL